jgi:malate dehydrogenase (oxaloacetate-decarboxylating)(NADP+)
VESLEEQTVRVLANLRAKANPLEQYRYLSALQNENETLFYRVALDHLEETLPIIYTPTVGQACLEWSRLYERPRGLYISAAQHAGRVADLLRDWPRRAGIIVVTDSGRILESGMHRRAGLRLDVRTWSLRRRQSIRPGDAQRTCARHRAGE